MYRIDELEDALVATVKTAGYDAAALNKAPDESALAGEAVETPKVFVVFNSAAPSKVRATLRNGVEFNFQFYVIARNLRGSSSAARGDVSSTGIYSVLDGLRAAINGSSLGLNVQPAAWVSEKADRRKARLSVYVQEWSITAFD